MRRTKQTVPYRRKRKGLTNYKKRLKLLLSNRPRLVVRRSLKNIGAQIIEYNKQGDKVLVAANSQQLEKFGWKASKGNLPSAYLVGLLVGKLAKEKGIKEVILDIGFNESVKGSGIYSLVKGVIDSGVNVPHNEEVFPDMKRISGEHIEKYASLLKKDQEAYNKIFSSYLKNNVDPISIRKYFEETKNKILGA